MKEWNETAELLKQIVPRCLGCNSPLKRDFATPDGVPLPMHQVELTEEESGYYLSCPQCKKNWYISFADLKMYNKYDYDKDLGLPRIYHLDIGDQDPERSPVPPFCPWCTRRLTITPDIEPGGNRTWAYRLTCLNCNRQLFILSKRYVHPYNYDI